MLAWLTLADHQPVHSYVADTQTVRQGCLADVRACEAYVLILGYRYGFVPPDENPDGLSITELEYRTAIEEGLPIVALRARGARDVSLTDIGTPVYAKVDAFVRGVERKHRVFLFGDEADLVVGLSSGLQRALRDGSRPDPGTLGQIGKLYLDDAKKAQMLLTQSLVILMPQHLEAIKRILSAGESPGAGDRERAAAQALRADDPWPACPAEGAAGRGLASSTRIAGPGIGRVRAHSRSAVRPRPGRSGDDQGSQCHAGGLSRRRHLLARGPVSVDIARASLRGLATTGRRRACLRPGG